MRDRAKSSLLIVEDDPDASDILADRFRFEGFEVTCTDSGSDAWVLFLRGLRPDAVILDIMLPGMDGVALRNRMMNDPELSRIAIFVVTAVACGLAGLCYAELTSVVPIAGSAYTYAYATLGQFVAWIIGWDLILEYAVGNAAVAIAWSDYFCSFLRVFHIDFPYWLATSYRDVAAAHPERMGELPLLFGHHIAVNLPGMTIVALITWLLVIGVNAPSFHAMSGTHPRSSIDASA